MRQKSHQRCGRLVGTLLIDRSIELGRHIGSVFIKARSDRRFRYERITMLIEIVQMSFSWKGSYGQVVLSAAQADFNFASDLREGRAFRSKCAVAANRLLRFWGAIHIRHGKSDVVHFCNFAFRRQDCLAVVIEESESWPGNKSQALWDR